MTADQHLAEIRAMSDEQRLQIEADALKEMAARYGIVQDHFKTDIKNRRFAAIRRAKRNARGKTA